MRLTALPLTVLALLLLISGCNSPATPAPEATASPLAAATEAPPPSGTPTPAAAAVAPTTEPIEETTPFPTMDPRTPIAMRIVSPELSDAVAFPTPTAHPTIGPLNTTALIATWPDPEPILPAQPIVGDLGASDGQLAEGGSLDLYEFSAVPGEIVTLDLTSTAFDTVVSLLNGKREIIAQNDDFQKATPDSRLVVPIPAEDTYFVMVSGYGEANGAYSLRLTSLDSRTPDNTLPLSTLREGWLTPGDTLDDRGLYSDEWRITMGEERIVVWAHSDEFDTRLEAWDAAGNLINKNNDLDIIGRQFDSRLVLLPSDTVPPGSEITLRVTLQGEFAIGGAYTLQAEPLPTDFSVRGLVTLRPIIVKGANGELGSEATESQIREAVSHAQEIWNECGVDIAIENDTIQTLSFPGLEYTVPIEVPGQEWTAEETMLMMHESHALPEEGIITIYFVRDADGRTGIAYPTTRYPARRGGVIIAGDNGITDERAFTGTLGHEIGHILGINHPDLSDGDTENDTLPNLMSINEALGPNGILTEEELGAMYDSVTPLQCTLARAAPYFMSSPSGEPLVPEPFRRTDRVLPIGGRVTGTLTTRDAVASEEAGHYLDVFYFHGKAGEEVTIDLTSPDFDTLLVIEGPSGEALGTVDDGGEGTNSRITLTLDEEGDYFMGVTSLAPAVGTYELAVSSAN